MSTTLTPRSAASGTDKALAELVEQLTERLKAHEAVDVEAVLKEHPEHQDELRRLLPALKMLADLSSADSTAGLSATEEASLGLLGDFRLLREVGRGGMGVVYEAEQISLNRRVALKVLPFAATMDPRHLQRFQNEARAAASLEHPHIVPVYAVSCERGVHFFAMKYIDGRTLAALIAQQRGERVAGPEIEGVASAEVLRSPGLPANAGASECLSPGHPSGTAPAADTVPAAVGRTERAPQDAPYFRRAAEWGIQAARALEHAHSVGMVHRDIKPANLMVDAQGHLWVTDFGLARTATDTGVTMTGDLVGTLRYMSPEQASAKHGLVDHRTDIYALGATLYELLTLRPAVAGKDREEIVRNLTVEEPPRPRALNNSIPIDLETIVLKALAKEPPDRYATAKEMAEDMERL